MKAFLKAVVFVVALVGAGAQGVFAQGEPAQGPAYLVTYIEVLPGLSGKAIGLARSGARLAQQSHGFAR